MIYFKTNEEIDLIRESCLLVSRTLAEIALYIQPGISTLELDRIAETFIRNNNGKPGFLGYQGYPNTLCTSVNNTVVHGIPSEYTIKDGDIVSIDCGVLLNGWYGDSCYTFMVGNVPEREKTLCRATYRSLEDAITAAIEGNRLGDIGHAVQRHAEPHDFTIVKDLVGHGLGRNLHEEPAVANYGKPGRGVKLRRGMVIAIEPMLNSGKPGVVTEDDGWTVKTVDGESSAHFEHTIAVRDEKAEKLSTFNFIEEAIKKNNFLWQNSLL
jgi:methionyl aminopeptidase